MSAARRTLMLSLQHVLPALCSASSNKNVVFVYMRVFVLFSCLLCALCLCCSSMFGLLVLVLAFGVLAHVSVINGTLRDAQERLPSVRNA